MKVGFPLDQHWKAGIARRGFFFFNNWALLSLSANWRKSLVLVSYGCSNKLLKQQKSILLQYWRLEVQMSLKGLKSRGWQGWFLLGVPASFRWLPTLLGLWWHHSSFCSHWLLFYTQISLFLPLIGTTVITFRADQDNLPISRSFI